MKVRDDLAPWMYVVVAEFVLLVLASARFWVVQPWWEMWAVLNCLSLAAVGLVVVVSWVTGSSDG